MLKIKADVPIAEPPAWALLERELVAVMEQAVEPFLEKYTHPDGRLIWREGPHQTRDGADDFYESFYNWPLLYLLGGSDRMLELGQRQWDATTRLLEELGHLHKEYEIGYDQFHQSESYIYFYLLCMADPGNARNMDRARRFAGFYLNEDPDAPNYDASRRIIRCVHNGSKGPRWLYEEDEEPEYGYSPGMAVYGLPFHDLAGIERADDLRDPENARRMGRAMKARMSRGDAVANLAVCSLIANAFLLTGEAKYRDWLVEYVGAWRDRADANDGLLPDNVGLSGEVGECMGGRWYGSMYGWTFPHGLYNVASAAIVAGTACYLATGDAAWLDLPRTQIGKAMELGEVADVRARPISLAGLWTGQFQALGDESEAWLVPYRHGTNGWCDWQPLSPVFPAALWNAAGEDVDLGMLEEIRRRETYDWRKVFSFRTKEDAGHEQPWLCFLRGENPDYPVQILRAALTQVHRRMEQIRQDDTDPRDNSIHQWQELNPVTCEALIQLTLGAPQMIYNGGLLLAPVRYFDAERRRPGLPRDVGALVERVEGQRLALRLVNLSHTSSRRLVVQAGTFGEHEFTELRYSKRTGAGPGNVEAHDAGGLTAGTETSAVNASRFEVELPPGTETRMEIGLLRAVNTASYGGPWD